MEPGSSTPGGTRGLPRTAAGNVFGFGRAAALPGIEVIMDDPAWRRILPRAEALARRAARAALREGARNGRREGARNGLRESARDQGRESAGDRGREGARDPGGEGAVESRREDGWHGGMTVLLADDRVLRRLNGEHRGRDKPTNVLSFPGSGEHLGDIALALGVVRREAAAAGKRPAAHFALLVAHGTLHLLGYDHETAGRARHMERAESRALHRMRMPNPWSAT